MHIAHAQFTCECMFPSLLALDVFEVLTDSLSISHLVAHDCLEVWLPFHSV